ncbi:MAG TPA: aquaporin [Steroidobacteraceae bacterium]|nr:aquaporin [Steroidobacteraceae bacterium]
MATAEMTAMTQSTLTLRSALREHWPEYLIEGWALGTFMLSAAVFATLLEAPGSPVHRAISDPDVRRALVGLAMGLTAIALIYSPWGRRSGAHMNPAVTLTFLRLGRMRGWDAAFYVVAQVLGGTLGVLLAAAALGTPFTAPPVNHAVTVPGPAGAGVAFLAELAISAVMMFTVVAVSGSARYMKYTGLCAGLLVATWITFEAPYSGMSMNPARTLASAWPAATWDGFWLYVVAPLAGMQLGAVLHGFSVRGPSTGCAKLCHGERERCIHCGYPGAPTPALPRLAAGEGATGIHT